MKAFQFFCFYVGNTESTFRLIFFSLTHISRPLWYNTAYHISSLLYSRWHFAHFFKDIFFSFLNQFCNAKIIPFFYQILFRKKLLYFEKGNTCLNLSTFLPMQQALDWKYITLLFYQIEPYKKGPFLVLSSRVARNSSAPNFSDPPRDSWGLH